MQSSFLQDVSITTDKYVLAIMRKSNGSLKHDHASIIVEGVKVIESQEKRIIWFFDFLPAIPGLPNTTVDGEIRMRGHDSTINKPGFDGIYFNYDTLYQLIGEKLLSTNTSFKACIIEKEIANNIMRTVEEQVNNPPRFNKAGSKAFLNSKHNTFFSENIHNCITWAEEVVGKQGIDLNNLNSAKVLDIFIAIPHNHVPHPDDNKIIPSCRIL